MDSLNKILSKIDEFPTLPTIYSAMSDVMANPRSTAADVASIIMSDQAAATKILKATNSPIYGFRGRITNITQAVTYIGFTEVRNLIIAMAVIEIFSKTNSAGTFSPVELWRHSIAVGAMARTIGQHVGARDLENFFLAGILHDIGKLLFYKFIPREYEQAINYALDNNISAKEAETEILGINHVTAGVALAEKWKLPPIINEAIQYHTSGITKGNAWDLVACVHVANIASALYEFGRAGEDMVPEPKYEVWSILNLPNDYFTKNIDLFETGFEESVKFLLNG